MTHVIKQRSDFTCVACVACMATGTGLKEFQRFFYFKGPPYSDRDLHRYLLSKGYVVGVGFQNVSEGKFKADLTLKIGFSVKDFAAYVIVKSQRFKGMEHVLYWTGSEILDPNPEIKTPGLPLSEYDIVAWYPISKFSDAGELKKCR